MVTPVQLYISSSFGRPSATSPALSAPEPPRITIHPNERTTTFTISGVTTIKISSDFSAPCERATA